MSDFDTKAAIMEYAIRLGDDSLIMGHRLSEWCSNAPFLEEDIPEALRFIRTSAAKMDTLLPGLLRLSRSGRTKVTIEALDINRLISKVIETTEFQIKEAGVTLEVDILPTCLGDVAQVNQVFSNILEK